MTDPPEDRHIPDLVSLREAAIILDLSRGMTHRLIKQGQLRGKRVDSVWVFRRVVVEKLTEQRA